MRILHVVTAFPRSPDDVIVPWLVELLKRLQAAGHEVDVFTSSYRGAPDQAVSGIPVHRFRYFPRRWERLTHEEAAPDRMKRSLLYRLMPACFVVAGMIAVWRLCRRQRYDVIHVHWPFPLALFGWAAQRARPAAPVTPVSGVELRGVKTARPLLRGGPEWAARRRRPGTGLGCRVAGGLRRGGCVRAAGRRGPARRHRGAGRRVAGGDEPSRACDRERDRRHYGHRGRRGIGIAGAAGRCDGTGRRAEPLGARARPGGGLGRGR